MLFTPLAASGAEAVMSTSAAYSAHQSDDHVASPRAVSACGPEPVRRARGQAPLEDHRRQRRSRLHRNRRTCSRATDQADAVGVTVMGGPQLTSAIAVSKAIREQAARRADHLGRRLSDRRVRMRPLNCAVRRLRDPRAGRGHLAELLDALATRRHEALALDSPD